MSAKHLRRWKAKYELFGVGLQVGNVGNVSNYDESCGSVPLGSEPSGIYLSSELISSPPSHTPSQGGGAKTNQSSLFSRVG